MPISAGEIRDKTSFVELYDGELTVHYRLIDALTLDEDAGLVNAAKRGKTGAVVAGIIHRCLLLISEWDLLDKPAKDGGKPIPLTKEALHKVSGDILTDILRAIREDRNVPGNE